MSINIFIFHYKEKGRGRHFLLGKANWAVFKNKSERQLLQIDMDVETVDIKIKKSQLKLH